MTASDLVKYNMVTGEERHPRSCYSASLCQIWNWYLVISLRTIPDDCQWQVCHGHWWRISSKILLRCISMSNLNWYLVISLRTIPYDYQWQVCHGHWWRISSKTVLLKIDDVIFEVNILTEWRVKGICLKMCCSDLVSRSRSLMKNLSKN